MTDHYTVTIDDLERLRRHGMRDELVDAFAARGFFTSDSLMDEVGRGELGLQLAVDMMLTAGYLQEMGRRVSVEILGDLENWQPIGFPDVTEPPPDRGGGLSSR